MSYVTDGKLGVDLARVGTAREEELGARVEANDGTYEYCVYQGSSALAQHSWVSIGDTGVASALAYSASVKRKGGVANQSAVPAGNVTAQYFWAWRGAGSATSLVKASCAADVKLYTSATAGYADDTSSSQNEIKGAFLRDARAASDGTAVVEAINLIELE